MVYIEDPKNYENNANNLKNPNESIFLENIPVSSSHGLTSKTNIDFATGFGSKKSTLISALRWNNQKRTIKKHEN